MSLGKKATESLVKFATDENVIKETKGLFGMLFPYVGVKQKAIEMYVEDIEKSDLPRETKISLLLNIKDNFKKIKNQKAITEIAMNNAKEGTDFSDNSGVNQEWLDRYMDSAKFVSSEDMQLIWGKILANEFENPGKTPPNMIRILSEITPELANAFRKICSMIVTIKPSEEDGKIEKEQVIIVPYSENKKELFEIGLGYEVLGELETLGVIKFSNGYVMDCSIGKFEVFIDNDHYEYQSNTQQFPIGNVILTQSGETLKRITESVEIENYHKIIVNFLTNNIYQQLL